MEDSTDRVLSFLLKEPDTGKPDGVSEIGGFTYMKKGTYLSIINKSDSCKLAVSDICYIARNSRKLEFETEQGTVETYEKMDEIEDLLGPEFFRCMSGCIVNMARITGIRQSCVYFDNGKSFRVGRDTYSRLKQRFNAYLRGLTPNINVEK